MFRPRSDPDTCSLKVTSIPPLRLHAWCLCAVQVTNVPPLRLRACCISGLQVLSRLQIIDNSQLDCFCLPCPFHILNLSHEAVYSDSVLGDFYGRSNLKNAAFFVRSLNSFARFLVIGI